MGVFDVNCRSCEHEKCEMWDSPCNCCEAYSNFVAKDDDIVRVKNFCRINNIEIELDYEPSHCGKKFTFINREIGRCYSVFIKDEEYYDYEKLIDMIRTELLPEYYYDHLNRRWIKDVPRFRFYGMTVDTSVIRPTKELLNEIYGRRKEMDFGIKKVIFSNPCTIVLWEDGTKTIVRKQKKDKFDPEKGLAMAIAKKALGTNESKSDYYDIFKRWIY